MDLYLYILLLLSGIFAGFIGTLAGLGAVISMYLLMDVFKLDPLSANATMRIGVLAMAIMAVPPFYKSKKLHFKESKYIIFALTIGSLFGFFTINHIDPSSTKQVFKYLLPVLLIIIISNPKKLVESTNSKLNLNNYLAIPFFLALGFYAGFIQIGTGIVIVLYLAVKGNVSLVDATGVKILAFTFYTTIGVLIFSYYGRIYWIIGGTLAIGQGLGGYLAAKFATVYPKANQYVRYLLIVMLTIAIIRMFKMYELFL